MYKKITRKRTATDRSSAMVTENHSEKSGVSLKRLIIKGSIFFVIIVSSLSCTQRKVETPNDFANNIFEAIKTNDPNKIKWLNEKDFKELNFSEEEKQYLQINIPEAKKQLKEIKTEWEDAGFDFSSYSIDNVNYEKEWDEEINHNVISGQITVTSNNKTFDICFKDVIEMNDFVWKYVHICGFEYLSKVKLIQDEDFEEFIFSLSKCFMDGKRSEIEKIILKDEINEMVLYDETMNPLDYLEKIDGEKFAAAIATFSYDVIDNNYSSFQLVYLQHTFVLDIDLMQKGKTLILRSKDKNVLSGVYFSYKNKWYIWAID